MNASYEAAKEYLYIKLTGEFVLTDIPGIIDKNIEILQSQNLHKILCDIRALTGLDAKHPSTMTKFAACQYIIDILPKHYYLAILVNDKQFEKDRFCENVLVNRGVLVKITYGINGAFKWLGIIMADNYSGTEVDNPEISQL